MPATDAARPHGSTRRDPTWLWVLAAALLVARVATGVYEEHHPLRQADLVSWVPAADAPARSRATHRPIFYDFSAEWCGPCQAMHDQVFANAKYAEALQGLAVPVRVVDRKREEGRNPAIVDSLQRAHGVSAFPTLVVVDANGRTVDRLEGYPGAQRFVEWLGRASVKARMTMPDTTHGLRVKLF